MRKGKIKDRVDWVEWRSAHLGSLGAVCGGRGTDWLLPVKVKGAEICEQEGLC